MSLSSYLTLLGENKAGAESLINKSRFIGYGCPCNNEEDAVRFIGKIREMHKDASHNCYAYIIGENAGIMRYSDDGEPGGTAGLPILDVLKGKKLVNCAVVVTRYFGGILLGKGGLVRAYTQSAVAACEASEIVRMESTDRYMCEVSYSLWDKVRYCLGKQPVEIVSSEFSSSITFTFIVRASDAKSVLDTLVAATDGTIFTLLEKTCFLPWKCAK